LKRIGQYQEALKTFDMAEKLGAGYIANSSAADVYAQQGQYERALDIYRSISGWEDDPTVLTAVADNLRRMGRVEEARYAYNHLLGSGGGVRAHAGLAEIAKGQGKLKEALDIYEAILKTRLDERDQLIYKLAYCNILKLMGRYDDAYRVIDAVVRDYPFAMQARFARGSILGLMGRELDGLRDLPASTSARSWQEWLRRYYRGLLLFKLQRYKDARADLVEELPRAIASGEERAILCMAAAVYFLRENETREAHKLLAGIHDVHDRHVQYLAFVLKLHLAAQQEDRGVIADMTAQIARLGVADPSLEKAVAALKKFDYAVALRYETEALLKLAA